MSSRHNRANTRYSVAIETEIIRDGQASTVRMVDLSLGGALMEGSLEPPLRVGERVDVSFHLPDLEQPLTAKAEVRWVENSDVVSVGIQFVTGFRAKQTWALSRFLERQAPA